MFRSFRRHPIAAGFLLSVVFIAGWLLSIAVKAWIDIPRVLKQASAPGRLTLRLSDVSTERQAILLAVEDPGFYSHHGIDVTTPGSGWTTITQGLVKVLFYEGFTPGTFHYRKFEQSVIALVFDRRVDKTTQLELFLNLAYFGVHDGHEVIGFPAAARTYFHKDVAALTREEYTSLVAMLIGPDLFNVAAHSDRNRERVGRIEKLLRRECAPRDFRDVYYEACRKAAS